MLDEDEQKLTDEEIELLFKVSTTFADFAYKRWVERKNVSMNT